MDKFEIRAAVAADVPILLSMIKRLAEYEKLAHEVVATEDILRANIFDRPSAEAWLAWEGERPVGMAIFFTSFSTFLGKPGIYLEDLFVVPECRGRGYGKALLMRLMELTHERGYGRLEWSVLDWNMPAIDFYRSLGAKPVQGWTRFRMDFDSPA